MTGTPIRASQGNPVALSTMIDSVLTWWRDLGTDRPMWRALLVLWAAACVAALIFVLVRGPILMLSLMGMLTFPLGYVAEIIVSDVAFGLSLSTPHREPLAPTTAVIVSSYGQAIVTWMLWAALGYWQWFVAAPWVVGKLGLDRFVPDHDPDDDASNSIVAMLATFFVGACVVLLAIAAFAWWLPQQWPSTIIGQSRVPFYIAWVAAGMGLASGIVGVILAILRTRPWLMVLGILGGLASGVLTFGIWGMWVWGRGH
jgi:hypothetical protein